MASVPDQWFLMEYSAAGLPANIEAVTVSTGKGLSNFQKKVFSLYGLEFADLFRTESKLELDEEFSFLDDNRKGIYDIMIFPDGEEIEISDCMTEQEMKKSFS